MLSLLRIGVNIFAAHAIADAGEMCKATSCEHAFGAQALLQKQVVSTKSALQAPQIVADTTYNAKVCEVVDRVFDLRRSDANEEACKTACIADSSCTMFSGIWDRWCIGCSKELTLVHKPNVLAFRKAAQETWALVHDGHCAGGFFKNSNQVTVDIKGCSEVCAASPSCGFISFRNNGERPDGGENNCALYTEAAGCPDDNNWAMYNSYKVTKPTPAPTPAPTPEPSPAPTPAPTSQPPPAPTPARCFVEGSADSCPRGSVPVTDVATCNQATSGEYVGTDSMGSRPRGCYKIHSSIYFNTFDSQCGRNCDGKQVCQKPCDEAPTTDAPTTPATYSPASRRRRRTYDPRRRYVSTYTTRRRRTYTPRRRRTYDPRRRYVSKYTPRRRRNLYR